MLGDCQGKLPESVHLNVPICVNGDHLIQSCVKRPNLPSSNSNEATVYCCQTSWSKIRIYPVQMQHVLQFECLTQDIAEKDRKGLEYKQ